jgi:hypothetical protein
MNVRRGASRLPWLTAERRNRAIQLLPATKEEQYKKHVMDLPDIVSGPQYTALQVGGFT